MKVSINPYLVVYVDQLIIFYKNDQPVMKVSMPVDQEILDAYGCATVRDYYNSELAFRIQEELEFDDNEMIALREFLEKNNYFESPLH